MRAGEKARKSPPAPKGRRAFAADQVGKDLQRHGRQQRGTGFAVDAGMEVEVRGRVGDAVDPERLDLPLRLYALGRIRMQQTHAGTHARRFLI